ncbi:teneurin-2 isoform X1 [Silurus asotus]|nr:teneurin-2 isoform X1 [Silurus asotus]
MGEHAGLLQFAPTPRLCLFFLCLEWIGEVTWLRCRLGEGVDHLLGTSPLEVATVAMDLKERRHRSLTRNRCAKELQFTTSTLDVPTQKSYSSSETLKAFEHEARLPYGGCVTDLVHHEADEYTRQGMGNFTLAELGICEPTSHQNTYCPNLGLLHGYALSAGSDADSDPEGPISPERAMQLWSTRNVKSRHSSGQSSHENSALTLTDSENENKSDDESGRWE